MLVKITKVTNKELADLACTYTAGCQVNIKNMKRMYLSEHSPSRTQMYFIEMQDIPTFVSVHLVRHKFGVEHYVKSNREDRGGDKEADRTTPVNHAMFLNAQALINMARKRLCSKASLETRVIMQEIKNKMLFVDSDLAACLIPECEYRGQCFEFTSCGKIYKKEKEKNE